MTEVNRPSLDPSSTIEKLLGTMFPDPEGYDAGVARTVLRALVDPNTFFTEGETRPPRDIDFDEVTSNAFGLQMFEDFRTPFLQAALDNRSGGN